VITGCRGMGGGRAAREGEKEEEMWGAISFDPYKILFLLYRWGDRSLDRQSDQFT
jgi:hypothetical protein